MRHRPTQSFVGDILAGDGLDDIGAGNKHLGDLFDHEDEVSHRW